MAKKKVKKQDPTTIKNCTFAGVTFDSAACEAIEVVADGLLKNAEGLCALAQVFRAQGIQIDCLVNVS